MQIYHMRLNCIENCIIAGSVKHRKWICMNARVCYKLQQSSNCGVDSLSTGFVIACKIWQFCIAFDVSDHVINLALNYHNKLLFFTGFTKN